MYYINFEFHVTFKFGVILECWPLQKFASPSTFSSLPIVNILYSAFESGATRFRALSDDEWHQWREAFQAGGSAPAVTPSPSLVPVQATDMTTADDSENPDHTPIANPDTAPSASDASIAAAMDGAPQATSRAVPASNAGSAPPTANAGAAPPTANSDAAPPTNSGAAVTPLAAGGPLVAPGQLTPAQSAPSLAADSPAAGQKRTVDQINGATDMFINNFGGTDGLVQVTKRARKKRSDAGVKRGPRKKPATTSVAASPA